MLFLSVFLPRFDFLASGWWVPSTIARFETDVLLVVDLELALIRDATTVDANEAFS